MNEHVKLIVDVLKFRIADAESHAHLTATFPRLHPESARATMRANVAKEQLEKYLAALKWIKTK